MLYGTGKYTYELVEGWLKCPNRWEVIAGTGLAVDSQDRVYVTNRSTHPVMVFDREGNLLTTFGERIFWNSHGSHMGAHAIHIGPDGSVYTVDEVNHVAMKFTPDGKLLMTLGNKGQPSDTGYVEGETI